MACPNRPTLRSALCVVVIAAGLLSSCGGGESAEQTTTTDEPASQFGSSMGTQSGDVADVAALGDGPGDGEVWQVPMGVSVCGRFVDVAQGAPVGSVTAGPAFATVTGTGGVTPTLADFVESAGIDLAAGRLTMPDDVVPPVMDNTDPPTQLAGATFASGDMCGDVTGEVQVWVYSADARRTGDGILVVTQDLGNIPFSDPDMAMVVAFTPESSLPTLPPSAMGA